jgi:predicted ribosome quality control (RQC) complex YloA/Tae2 family protein
MKSSRRAMKRRSKHLMLKRKLMLERKETHRPSRSPKAPESVARVRRYRSSDGYEILVGRAARQR